MCKPLIFDGHNDVLSRMSRRQKSGLVTDFRHGDGGHIDVEKAKAGGLAGGFFAVFVPSSGPFRSVLKDMSEAPYDVPLPPPVSLETAKVEALAQIDLLNTLQEQGLVKICTTVTEIAENTLEEAMAAVLHLEGAEAIDPDLENIDELYSLGVRSLGPVWSRNNAFGEGVPFQFPSKAGSGGGLTELGVSLVQACNRKGILVDVSHLTEASFWDVARTTAAPIVATHSNVQSLSQHSRNLTDKQLHAIAESRGLVGLNYATALLREDGRMVDDVPVEALVLHLSHMLSILGEDGVALGSDFDGALVPNCIQDASGLGVLRQAMSLAGFGDALIQKICFDNWIDVLRRTWTV